MPVESVPLSPDICSLKCRAARCTHQFLLSSLLLLLPLFMLSSPCLPTSGRRSRLIAVVDGCEERREKGEMEREDERVRQHK